MSDQAPVLRTIYTSTVYNNNYYDDTKLHLVSDQAPVLRTIYTSTVYNNNYYDDTKLHQDKINKAMQHLYLSKDHSMLSISWIQQFES